MSTFFNRNNDEPEVNTRYDASVDATFSALLRNVYMWMSIHFDVCSQLGICHQFVVQQFKNHTCTCFGAVGFGYGIDFLLKQNIIPTCKYIVCFVLCCYRYNTIVYIFGIHRRIYSIYILHHCRNFCGDESVRLFYKKRPKQIGPNTYNGTYRYYIGIGGKYLYAQQPNHLDNNLCRRGNICRTYRLRYSTHKKPFGRIQLARYQRQQSKTGVDGQLYALP